MPSIFMSETCGLCVSMKVSFSECLLHELTCNNSYHFPLCLGRHAGVAVHQRLRWLWERVGDAVTETLAQTSSAKEDRRHYFLVPTDTTCFIHLHGQIIHGCVIKNCKKRKECEIWTELRMQSRLRTLCFCETFDIKQNRNFYGIIL